MLMRSLFISGISSNRFLLIPSLRLLSFLSKPDRSYLFNVDRNIVLHGILKKTFYDQFCAGETLEETHACVQKFKKLGFKGFILTYAKEVVLDQSTKDGTGLEEEVNVAKATDQPDKYIEHWRTGTLQTMKQIGSGDILAIKISGAGPSVTDALAKRSLPPAEMFAALDEIATQAQQNNIRIIVDAESQHFQDAIAATALELMRKYNRNGFALIYNTYQAYLKSTPSVVQQHLSEAEKGGFTLGLKVVRGAYIMSEERSLIHDTKQDTDNAYNSIVQGALRLQYGDFGPSRPHPFPSLNLLVASHNRDSVLSAHRLHQGRVKAGLPTVPVIYAQLHGMSDEVSFSLLREKGGNGMPPDVYKCSTWGTMGECVGYLLRRAPALASFDNYIACVRSTNSKNRLAEQFPTLYKNGSLTISQGPEDTVKAASTSDVIILGVDPADVEATMKKAGLSSALKSKLLISVAAGWTRESLESMIPTANPEAGSERTWVLRTLPNIAALASQSLTAIEDPHPDMPVKYLNIASAIFSQIGRTIQIAPRLMPATTAVGGSTPAFFAVICDAMIDASVAVGVPRAQAQEMIYQSMRGTAEMLQGGLHPGLLKDQGTSPEGCTMAGLMVLEEGAVRGTVGRAVREAVTVSRLMGTGADLHVNDTRQNGRKE
ncbi:FAD-linked oxidoreductase [Periconia macrospinosa]|uniref:Proline dehydrogenase n=1 Tax=Periconia macrospinosa TaxID=97972 RepID=A0A2V1E3E4_9PLEO|nr:FAD-linked oxidoreductase [Periconia macrospinosa]